MAPGPVNGSTSTPSQAGRPLSLLRSFAAPAAYQLQDPKLIRERVQGAASGLLSLLGLPADPLRSREHILLCQILDGAFRAGHGLSLAELIHSVQAPAFSHVGVFELDTFYPRKDRLELAMALNNLLAAPGAQALSQGEPLEIASLLRTNTGKPKLSIISIAHLNDTERMAQPFHQAIQRRVSTRSHHPELQRAEVLNRLHLTQQWRTLDPEYPRKLTRCSFLRSTVRQVSTTSLGSTRVPNCTS